MDERPQQNESIFSPEDILRFKSQLSRYYSLLKTLEESDLGGTATTDNNQNKSEIKAEEDSQQMQTDQVSSDPIAPTLSWQCTNSLLFMGSNTKLEAGQISISHGDIGCFSKSTFIPLVTTFPYASSVSEKLSRNFLSNDDELLGIQHTERAKLVHNSGLRFNIEVPVVNILKSAVRHKRQQYRDRRNIERDDKKRKLEIDQERKKKLLEFNRNLMNHREEFFRFHKNKKLEIARAAKAVKSHLELVEYRKEKDETNAEARRIKALKENDMEAYLTLVQETKNDRLHFLINQTDSFILKIQHMMEGQRNDNSNTNSFGDGKNDDIEKDSKEGKGGTKVMKEYYNTAHSKFEKVCQPSILKGGDLKEYQLSGLQWLVSLYNNNLNGILADEMGLGKTIQTIALLAYIMEVKKVNGPFLIVVPLSTLSNWVNEASKWCPDMIKVVYKGTPNERKKIFKEEIEARQFNLLLTTYEYIMKDKSTLKKIEWVYIIVDEGHRMKNANSKFAQTLGLVYRSKNRILLTGTPLQNNLPELWALLNFLLPSVFSSLDSFDEWFNKPFASFRNTNNINTNEDSSLSQEERLLIVHRLHEVLRPFMLRRIKDQVLDQLPEKVEKVIKCELSGWQKTLYRAIQQKSSESGEGGSSFNNAIMQLRKVCNHPFLFLSEWNIDDYIIRSSGKFDLLNRMLPKLKRAGHRVLMFSQMTQLMTILERYFDMKGYKYLRLDGSTSSEERERTMFMFNDPNSPHFIFLLSTRAGGLGLNLASADTVILFDSDWNPMMDAQAQDRAHRIGQKNEVRVFRFITNSPVEERILARATDKKNLNSLVVEAGQFSNRGQDKKVEDEDANKEMMEVLLKEYAAGGNNVPSNVGIDEEDEDEKEYEEKDNDNNDDINMMMAINESELALYQEMDRQKKFQDAPLLGIDEVPAWLTVNHWHTKHNALVNILNNTKLNITSSSPLDDQSSRKRKDVVYDDQLTEKQFMRQMDKKIKEDEKEKHSKVNIVIKKEEKVKESIASDGLSEHLSSIVKELHKIKRDDGSLLIELFREKPDKKYFPDYYNLISKPLSFKEITQKINKKLYKSIDEIEQDLAIICNNARVYNTDKSLVYLDSEMLRTEFYNRAYDIGLLNSNVKPDLPIVGSNIQTSSSVYGSSTPAVKAEPKKLILKLNLNKHSGQP